jgi:hypothetical protein
MARRVFFSFHYTRDILKIGQIRNAWLLTRGETQPFLDKTEWESIKRQGDDAVKRWIDAQLYGTSVTIVLIGAETYTRKWVKYEIEQSHVKGNGMLGIDMYGMKDLNGQYDLIQGQNPFNSFKFTNRLSQVVTYPVYSWEYNNGRVNIGQWIEFAAKNAGR